MVQEPKPITRGYHNYQSSLSRDGHRGPQTLRNETRDTHGYPALSTRTIYSN